MSATVDSPTRFARFFGFVTRACIAGNLVLAMYIVFIGMDEPMGSGEKLTAFGITVALGIVPMLAVLAVTSTLGFGIWRLFLRAGQGPMASAIGMAAVLAITMSVIPFFLSRNSASVIGGDTPLLARPFENLRMFVFWFAAALPCSLWAAWRSFGRQPKVSP